MSRAKMHAQKRLEKTLRFQPLAKLKAQVERQVEAKAK